MHSKCHTTFAIIVVGSLFKRWQTLPRSLVSPKPELEYMTLSKPITSKGSKFHAWLELIRIHSLQAFRYIFPGQSSVEDNKFPNKVEVLPTQRKVGVVLGRISAVCLPHILSSHKTKRIGVWRCLRAHSHNTEKVLCGRKE